MVFHPLPSHHLFPSLFAMFTNWSIHLPKCFIGWPSSARRGKLLPGQSEHITPSNHNGSGSPRKGWHCSVGKKSENTTEKCRQLPPESYGWSLEKATKQEFGLTNKHLNCDTKQWKPVASPCLCTVDMPLQLTSSLWICQTLILLLSVRCFLTMLYV